MYARPHLTLQQTAEHFGVTQRTIRRWISQGILPAKRIGPRTIRIKVDDLDRVGRKIGGAA